MKNNLQKQRSLVGFDTAHLKLLVLFLCFFVHRSTDWVILTDEIIKISGQFTKAKTEQSMSEKLLDASH